MNTDSKTAGADAPPRVSGHAWYGLALIFIINVVNYGDRTIIGVLIEPIRKDLHLTDTQIGLITGFAFALFYAVAGLFISYLADIGPRRLVISISMVVWSAMTAMTGMVTNFWQLFLARMGIGLGEAGALPAANSLVADWFAPARRPFAMAVLNAGVFAGIMTGSLVGGLVAERFGWRWAFFVAGMPGIPLALLTLVTMREPARGEADGLDVRIRASLVETVRALLYNPTYVLLILAFAFNTFLTFGVMAWFPAYSVRMFGLSQAQVGVFFGTAIGVGTVIGSLGGGIVANWLSARWLGWLTLLPVFLSLASMVFYEAAAFAPSVTFAFGFLILGTSAGGALMGPTLSAIQTIVKPHMRASAAGLNGVVFSVIGHGGAPLTIGLLSDWWARPFGPALGLRYALGAAILSGLVTAAFFLLAHRSHNRAGQGADGAQPQASR
jgi:predicted MFS family arabinose efflux permease